MEFWMVTRVDYGERRVVDKADNRLTLVDTRQLWGISAVVESRIEFQAL